MLWCYANFYWAIINGKYNNRYVAAMLTKSNSPVLVALCLFLLLVGCGRNPGKEIVGKWVVDDEPEILTMEFSSDGRVTSTYKEGVVLDGTWTVQPDKTILIAMEVWKITAQFEGNKLILRSDNKEKAYRKIE